MFLGCDPEIFLQDATNALKSAIGRIGGSKHAPRMLDELGHGYAVQEDNVALEFNIPPAGTEDEFVASVTRIREHLRHIVAKQSLTFSTLSAAAFPESELQHPAAMEFGCDPDYNVWTLKRNPRPKASDPTLRSCGGHIHVGDKFISKKQMFTAVKLMDLYIGVPSVLQDNGELRKKLYGNAGCFRIKPYGFEYRTPSNYWIFDDKLCHWVWQNTQLAVQMAKEGVLVDHLKDDICSAINNNNKDLAARLIHEQHIPML